MANPVTIKLSKSGGERWGFRLGGGKDFGTPLSIHKVTGGSLAERAGLRAGDLLTRVNDTDTNTLTHKEALDLIAKAKDNFTVTTQRRADVHLAMTAEHMGSPQVMNGPTFKSTSRPVSMVYDNLASPPVALEEFTEDAIAETLSSQSEVLNTGSLGVNFLKYEKKHYDPQQSAVYKMIHSIDEDPEPKIASLPEKGVEERVVRPPPTRDPARPAPAIVPSAKKPAQTQPVSKSNLQPRPQPSAKPVTVEHKPVCAEVNPSAPPRAVPTTEPEAPASVPAPKQKRMHSNVKPSSVIWPPPPPVDSDEEEEPPMAATAACVVRTAAPPTTPQVKDSFHEVNSPARTYTKPVTNPQPPKVATPTVAPQALPTLQPHLTSPIAISTANSFSESVGSPSQQQAPLLSGPPLPELYPVTGPPMPAVRQYIAAAQPAEVPKPTKQYKLPMTPSATLSKPVGPSQPPQKTVVISSNITPMSSLTRLATPNIPKSVPAGHERPANTPSAPEKKRVEGTNKVLNIKSFNSPVGLYSEATLREAITGNKEEEAVSSGAFNFGRWEKDYGFLRNSEVYRLIHDMETNPASKEDAGAQ